MLGQKSQCNPGSFSDYTHDVGWGRIHFQAHSPGCWKDSVLQRLLARGHLQPLTIGLLQGAAHEHDNGFHQSKQWGKTRTSAGKIKFPVFCNLILEVTLSHFSLQYCSWETGHQVLSTSRQWLHKSVNPGKWGSLDPLGSLTATRTRSLARVT